MKALVIEDDKRISYAVCECIGDMFETDTAYNGQDGLEFAKENIYDVIILDLMMPVMDGFVMLEQLRKADIQTPVLILTAKDATSDVVKGLKIGADDYLIKPFKGEELLARCEAMVRRNLGGYKEKCIYFKDLKLKPQTRQADINGNPINLLRKAI